MPKPTRRPAETALRTATASGTATTLNDTFRQWVMLRGQHSALGVRMNRLKQRMREAVDTSGTTEAKGHRLVEFDDPIQVDGVTYIGMRNEKRTSTTLASDAEEFLRQRGLWEEAIEIVETIDQDRLYRLYQLGKLSDEDMAVLFQEHATWAFTAVKAA